MLQYSLLWQPIKVPISKWSLFKLKCIQFIYTIWPLSQAQPNIAKAINLREAKNTSKQQKEKEKLNQNTEKTNKQTPSKTKNWLVKLGTEGWLKRLQRITLDNVLREVVPECRSMRIEVFLAQGETTERRNNGMGVQVTKWKPWVRL